MDFQVKQIDREAILRDELEGTLPRAFQGLLGTWCADMFGAFFTIDTSGLHM